MLRHLQRFKKSEEGVAFLEFAVCLPFLLVLLMGSIEVTRYILIVQKVEKTAVTISDIASQGAAVSTADLNNIVLAATQVMKPYTFGPSGYVIISSVTQTGAYSISNKPKVKWQYTSSGANGSWTQPSQVGTLGGNATLPGGLTLFDKDNVIVTEIYYNYTPITAVNGVISGSSIYKSGVFKPRLGDLSTLSWLPLAMRGELL
jgi:Flp pilus assembly protein TadG